MSENSKKSLVIYFTAGAMSGIFSAGFSKVIAEAGLKPYIQTIYGNSAGSLTALYFASNQIDLGAALYYEDLNGTKYIRWSRLKKYVLYGFCNYFFGTKLSTPPVFDIDYIEKIITTKRKVDWNTVENCGMDLFMIAYNLKTSHHDYLKLEWESDIVPFLRATGGGHPAYPHSTNIHGGVYVDGGTIDDERRISRIIERHPDKEIIVVLNNPKWEGSKFKNFLDKVSIALVMLPFFGIKEAIKTARSDFSNLDVEKMKISFPNLHFIANDLIGYQMSTNPVHHKMLYLRGQELAKEFLLSGELKSVEIDKEKLLNLIPKI